MGSRGCHRRGGLSPRPAESPRVYLPAAAPRAAQPRRGGGGGGRAAGAGGAAATGDTGRAGAPGPRGERLSERREGRQGAPSSRLRAPLSAVPLSPVSPVSVSRRSPVPLSPLSPVPLSPLSPVLLSSMTSLWPNVPRAPCAPHSPHCAFCFCSCLITSSCVPRCPFSLLCPPCSLFCHVPLCLTMSHLSLWGHVPPRPAGQPSPSHPQAVGGLPHSCPQDWPGVVTGLNGDSGMFTREHGRAAQPQRAPNGCSPPQPAPVPAWTLRAWGCSSPKTMGAKTVPGSGWQEPQERTPLCSGSPSPGGPIPAGHAAPGRGRWWHRAESGNRSPR